MNLPANLGSFVAHTWSLNFDDTGFSPVVGRSWSLQQAQLERSTKLVPNIPSRHSAIAAKSYACKVIFLTHKA